MRFQIPEIATIQAHEIDDLTKGIPGGTAPFKLGEIAEKGWNVLNGDLPLPLAVLKESALDNNRLWMRRFLDATGADICPHGKTTMSPQLFDSQLQDGAWGITAATIGHVQIFRRYGIKRIFLANQLLGREEIRYVLDELHRDPSFDFYCIVDSEAGIELLAEAAAAAKSQRPINVLIEAGFAGGRTGTRTLEEALTAARRAHTASPYIALRGVEAFEGIVMGKPDAQQKVGELIDRMVEIAERCDAESLFADDEIILTAGGSAYFDLAARGLAMFKTIRPRRVVLRSGCYLTHDSGLYADMFGELQRRGQPPNINESSLTPALELWAHVQSTPEPGLAFATLGKRDAGEDSGLPKPLNIWRDGKAFQVSTETQVTAMNDQHAYIKHAVNDDIRFGDRMTFGVSHPCTTFDKWRVLFVVDDGYNVTGAVKTFF